jgi:hypothetical protein
MGFASNRFLPGGLASERGGLGQEARQHGHPPVRYSTKRVERSSTRFAFVAERTVLATHLDALGDSHPGALRKPLRSAWQM